MVTPIDPTAVGFLLAENRNMPMHVGGLQLFKKPEGAGRNYVREMYEQMRDVERDRAAVPQAPAPLGAARPASWSGGPTSSSTSSTTSGTARCPSPAGSASCSTSARGCTAPGWPGSGRCGRPTSSRACATAGSRCTPRSTTRSSTASRRCGCSQSVLRTDPDERDMPAPWATRPPRAKRERGPRATAERIAVRGAGRRRCARRSASPPRPPACPAR